MMADNSSQCMKTPPRTYISPRAVLPSGLLAIKPMIPPPFFFSATGTALAAGAAEPKASESLVAMIPSMFGAAALAGCWAGAAWAISTRATRPIPASATAVRLNVP